MDHYVRRGKSPDCSRAEGDDPLSVDLTHIFIIWLRIHCVSSPIAPFEGGHSITNSYLELTLI
jgi:hypothetical protein